MGQSARVGRIVWFVAALAAMATCNDKVNHLGNGRLDGGTACPHAQVNANEVVWIGDSWILVPGSQQTRVRDLARAAGAIGPNDDYVVRAAPATTMAAIADQYAAQQAGATKVKVLIMDGGTWDTIVANGSDASVDSAVNAFRQFLTQVAADGTVEDIIYFLPPELPGIPGVAALRPRVRQACAESAVPCYFLDLQPLLSGHPEYTAGIFPTDAGAEVVADEIWAVMRQRCIAQ